MRKHFQQYAICLGILVLATAIEARAVMIEEMSDQHGGVSLLISGPIESGDSRKLAAALVKNNSTVTGVLLSSGGGDVLEAIRMGEIIKAVRISTAVNTFSECASACFFLWINGATRLASSTPKFVGRLGLHRPYLTAPQNNESSLRLQTKLQQDVTLYLESKLVQRKFIDLMMTRPSSMVYWMSDNDLGEIGVTPPDLEELYIARCHLSMRQLLEKSNWWRAMGDDQKLREIDTQVSTLFNCQLRLDYEVQKTAIEKLRSGWLPLTSR